MTDMLVQPQPPPQRNGLVDAISLAGHLLELRMDRALSSIGLTARQHQALRHISNVPGLSRAALAKALRISPQAAGTLTRRLRDGGLINCDGAAPGMPVAFTATESGRARLAQAAPITAEADRHIMARLPSVTRDFLADAMRTLIVQVD